MGFSRLLFLGRFSYLVTKCSALKYVSSIENLYWSTYSIPAEKLTFLECLDLMTNSVRNFLN